MLKAFRYRLYPTKEQKVLLEKHFGCSRFIYNWGLERKTKHYKETQKSMSCNELVKSLVPMKQELPWLAEVNSQSLQMALRNLDNAFTNFFNKRADFPRFRNRRGRQSFQCPQKTRVDFEAGLLHLLKIPNIKCVFHRRFEGKIKTATISRVPSGKYFASILVETHEELPEKPTIKSGLQVGIDLGLKDFATLSTGEKIAHPKHLKRSLRNLKIAQHKFGKKPKTDSKRREKAKKRVARLYERVKNQRDDFLHKLTHRLCHENQVSTYVLETLSVKNMSKNHKLAQAVMDSGWSRFGEMMEYKSDWYGKNLVRIGRFEPSSKVCSACGCIKRDLTLSDREWTCPDCHAEHDRDVNAAINIKDFGLRNVGKDQPELTLGETVPLGTSMNREATGLAPS